MLSCRTIDVIRQTDSVAYLFLPSMKRERCLRLYMWSAAICQNVNTPALVAIRSSLYIVQLTPIFISRLAARQSQRCYAIATDHSLFTSRYDIFGF